MILIKNNHAKFLWSGLLEFIPGKNIKGLCAPAGAIHCEKKHSQNIKSVMIWVRVELIQVVHWELNQSMFLKKLLM